VLNFLLITGAADIAAFAISKGVGRVFVDMEVLGKAERQGHLDTHKAAHTFADIAALRSILPASQIMVRVNPLHEGTKREVDCAIECGAGRLMLPMFRSAAEVALFSEYVNARVPITFLVETPQSLVRLEHYLHLLGSGDEIYFGLNDLSLAMGLDFLFEPLAAGLLERPAQLLRAKKVPFGFGGIARVGAGELPGEWVLGEHVRLGSSLVILSRAFHAGASNAAALEQSGFEIAVNQVREIERYFQAADSAELEKNRLNLMNRVFEIASRKRSGV
jgi:hypothetical protein